ncbi:MAG: hypothetical protein EOP40_07040 [Rubrivivax sp.]|nr:MAG: hypothetical protein EOP40_07040 [Rubrivivax sp.]
MTKTNIVWSWAARLLVGLALVLLCAWGAALWYFNRPVEPPTRAQSQVAFERAVSWFKANEQTVLQDSNSALWLMIDHAARIKQDAYLGGLVQRHLALVYPQNNAAQDIWHRIVAPDGAAGRYTASERDGWDPYQRFLAYALTCDGSLSADPDVAAHLSPQACRPMHRKVWAGDPVCSTHQAVGLMLMQRERCGDQAAVSTVLDEVVADIDEQLHWDVVVRDAYLQRVLLLMWHADSASAAKPIWLVRVLRAQSADGGWSPRRQMPEWPAWLQPSLVRDFAARWRPGLAAHAGNASDFHASAQGLLITALASR